MSFNKILIVSDNENLARLLNDFLKQADYDTAVSDTKNALSAAALGPDLIIAQIESYELFESLVVLKIPLFVLISERSALNRIMLLERGADDIMTVPLDAREVVARTRVLLRRNSAAENKQTLCSLDGLTIDLTTYTATIGGKCMTLPAKETELLFLLATNVGKVFRRRDILMQIWKTPDMSERAVDMHISKLRSVLPENSVWKIDAVRGVGYKFDRKN